PRAGTRIVAVGLALCLLVLNGVMYPQTVAHAAHHAHHKAATHSTALCTWMCAAGQAQEHVSYNFQIEMEVVSPVDGFLAQQPIELHFVTPTTRGPPSFFL
ncbi:MAG: hypothetical protein M3Z35_05710, partial [Nitrospirota bacterium]|nr:hypothetical protein [Nitrospirota bacterium]